MSGVGDQLTALKSLREECQNAARDLQEQAHATSRYFGQNTQVTGAMARGSLAAAEKSRQEVESLVDQSLPDWPRLRQVLARALEEYAIARNQAEADVQVHQELSSTFDRVRQDSSRVRAFLAGHEEDRLAANQHYQAAETALNQVQSESTGSSGEWARLLELVRGAAADLCIPSAGPGRHPPGPPGRGRDPGGRAAPSARPGPIFRWVSRSIPWAPRIRYRRPSSFTVPRITSRPSGSPARRCRRSARPHTVAVQQAFWRQMQVDAERRRYAAASRPGSGLGGAAAVAAGAVILDAIAGSAQAQGVAAPPEPGSLNHSEPEPSTATGSWSSETAERSW